jgi:hypothetical protein
LTETINQGPFKRTSPAPIESRLHSGELVGVAVFVPVNVGLGDSLGVAVSVAVGANVLVGTGVLLGVAVNKSN